MIEHECECDTFIHMKWMKKEDEMINVIEKRSMSSYVHHQTNKLSGLSKIIDYDEQSRDFLYSQFL